MSATSSTNRLQRHRFADCCSRSITAQTHNWPKLKLADIFVLLVFYCIAWSLRIYWIRQHEYWWASLCEGKERALRCKLQSRRDGFKVLLCTDQRSSNWEEQKLCPRLSLQDFSGWIVKACSKGYYFIVTEYDHCNVRPAKLAWLNVKVHTRH